MRRKSRTTHRLNYVSRSQCSLYPLYRKSRLVSNVLFTPDCSCVFYVYIFLYSFDASDTVYSWPQKISATLYKTLRLGINRCVLSPTLTTNSQRAPVCCFAPLQMPWTCAITLFHSCICSRVSVCESALWFFVRQVSMPSHFVVVTSTAFADATGALSRSLCYTLCTIPVDVLSDARNNQCCTQLRTYMHSPGFVVGLKSLTNAPLRTPLVCARIFLYNIRCNIPRRLYNEYGVLSTMYSCCGTKRFFN